VKAVPSGVQCTWLAMACMLVVMGERRNCVPGALQQAENVLWADMVVTAKVFTVLQIHCLRCTPVLTVCYAFIYGCTDRDTMKNSSNDYMELI